MTADLPPDVRDRAARAGHKAMLDWRVPPEGANGGEIWEAMVDAVTAAVAEEIARPLQARIKVLEADIAHREGEKWFHLHFTELYSQALRTMARRTVQYRKIVRQLLRAHKAEEARVELLTAALTKLISEVDRRCWVNDHEVLDPARAALAAGETESEACGV